VQGEEDVSKTNLINLQF